VKGDGSDGKVEDGKEERGSGRGRQGRERGGRAGLGYLSGAPEFLVTPLCRVRLAATAARQVDGRVTTGRRLNGSGAVNRRRHLDG